jgi:hypothetical protein
MTLTFIVPAPILGAGKKSAPSVARVGFTLMMNAKQAEYPESGKT